MSQQPQNLILEKYISENESYSFYTIPSLSHNKSRKYSQFVSTRQNSALDHYKKRVDKMTGIGVEK